MIGTNLAGLKTVSRLIDDEKHAHVFGEVAVSEVKSPVRTSSGKKRKQSKKSQANEKKVKGALAVYSGR